MTPSENWKSFFENWPEEFPRSGIILSSLNEAMPFRNFWLKKDILLLERTNPDAMGGRFLLMGFDVINTVKFVTPLTEAAVANSGFVASGTAEMQPC